MLLVEKASRMNSIPPYLFAELDEKKRELVNAGKDIIDLGIGDPDIPTPSHIIKKMAKACEKGENHRYPPYPGTLPFREAVAKWYKNRFDVELDPENEVLALIGSKDGIAHIPFVFIDSGDIALVPSPGYPVYHQSVAFAGGDSFFMILKKENHFLPDLGAIPSEVLSRAKMMFINYPNNPTSAIASLDFFNSVISFAKKHKVLVCHDAAYSEIYFDGNKPVSFLQADGAKDVGVEFHSFSKTYNMTGWRLGWVVGNREVIKALGLFKSHIDSGIFSAIQEAGIEALTGDQSSVEVMRNIYQERRDILVKYLKDIGLDFEPCNATFYLWVQVPKGYSSTSFTSYLLEKAGIVVTPGSGLGEGGEGYIRISLTADKKRIEEAGKRLSSIKF
ncbi:MAG: LL-diaminopimelate aminotransferase [Deltaproteobacteria bacterium]|nr:MAG: LL-diaminopimelate aminotransferase [Deltaproteobacteria bacterium]